MGRELFDLLGLEPDNPRIQDAIEDAKDAERLIDTLVELRVRQGLTQAEVAFAMETTQSAVSKFERSGGDPRLSTVQRYARASGARVRLTVDVSRPKTNSWQVTYHVPAVLDNDIDESDTQTELCPVIDLAS
ncbi:helix-turn-helix domain-containing protein [Micromonospora rubida]|uniref:Helix-turn-helix domain-containing protein n=1 Tax=Micromonospora rubida TaxID=2697657 RepID=A0ABW7SMD5_9ACTN